jgi:tripartite-type tricarboxylate transporter receptor subunit TctC
MKRFEFAAAVFAIMAATFLAGAANAQTYPDRTIKFIVPDAPGGITDAQARIVANALTAELNQQIVIENKPGASGAIGIEQLKKSPPDGYTFLVFSTSQAAILPQTSKLQFTPGTDYEPVSNFADSAFALVITASVPAKTVAEFASWAKTQSNLNYASPGVGTTTNLAMTHFPCLSP